MLFIGYCLRALFYTIQVSRTFAEMMFKHGFVHCDPHAANLLVRTLPSSKRGIFGKASNF